MRRIRLTGWALAGLAACALAGCGAGDSNVIQDYFGTGSTPGSTYAVEQAGVVKGLIVLRTRDQKILIVGSAADVTEASTPVVGAKVELVELNLVGATGATGTYLFNGVQPGDLTLRITLPAANGGVSADFKIRLSPGQTLAGLPSGANL